MLQLVWAATIGRYLKTAKAKDQISGLSTAKKSVLLCNSSKVRRSGDEVEAEPGFFEGDTVSHCGPTLKGEFARTFKLTDVYTGWVFTRSIRSNAHTHILSGLKSAVAEIPYAITGLGFDNGSEFLNHPVIEWAGGRGIYFTRSCPYKKNDQATIELKNITWCASTRSTTATTPAVAAGQRPHELPDPDHQTHRIHLDRRWTSPSGLRRSGHSAGPSVGRWSAQSGAASSVVRLPRYSQPRQDRPGDRRTAKPTLTPGRGQNRTDLPRHVSQCTARCTQKDPSHRQLMTFRGQNM